ncbi:CAP domain-containing protein [Actinotalea ferrariae]|uniref:CAP domain-containing protein n=1 Tax=Actinotalea ferrariae TaxID=1386098 RepID=UPI001C8C5E95|nr:CAP domain-containing protein [Actinotalea ferrariae]MBX9244245.1 CAP domain-containing protein [Actinotalea ferrariae]
MRRRSVGVVLVLGAALAGCDGAIEGGVHGDHESGLASATEAVRQERGAAAPTWSTCAADAALARAEALVGEPELTHAPLDDVIADCGVTVAAENLSRAPAGTPADDVVAAWMDSPGHRSNLLDPELTQVGVGCVEDGEALLCAQVFLGPPRGG